MLHIKNILEDPNEANVSWIRIYFNIDFKEDGLLLQKIVRSILHTHGVESTFGYDENYNEVLAIDYLCRINSVIAVEIDDKNIKTTVYEERYEEKILRMS